MNPILISVIALSVSALSLWLSFKSFRFNTEVKRAELLIALQTRLLSAKERIRRQVRDVQECRSIAAKFPLSGLPEAADKLAAEIDGLSSGLNELSSGLENLKKTRHVTAYELMMAKVTHVDVWLEVTGRQLDELRAGHAKLLKG